MTFTYNDIDFEGRQTESNNIVWFKDYPERSTGYPRSFDYESIAEALCDMYGINQ